MNYETLIVERAEPVVTITLNRPEKLNAVNQRMLQELADVVGELRRDTATRFVILTGAGRAFSTGADLNLDRDDSLAEEVPEHVEWRLAQLASHDLLRNLQNLEQVTIAAVNGYCLAAGLVFAMVCDFIIVADDAVIAIPEANVGAFYTWGASARLSRLVGPLKAKEMIMTCANVSAEEAVAMGLANKMVPADQLMAAAWETAENIARKSPIAIRLTKKLVNAATAPGPGDVYMVEPELVERNFLSGDIEEGGRAFIEKRAPKFSSS